MTNLYPLFQVSMCLPDGTFLRKSYKDYLVWLDKWNTKWKETGQVVNLQRFINNNCRVLTSQ